MSINKKKRKINFLSSQKLTRRTSFRVKNPQNSIFKYSFNFFKKLIFSPIFFLLFLVKFFKNKPILFYSVFVLTVFFIVLTTQNYFKETVDNTLPTQIQINIDNPQISKNILAEVTDRFNYVKKKHDGRALLLTELNNLLSSFDSIDQYWIRLGLDNVLQITATLQVPRLIINAKNNERFVISNRMKIIAKNPLPDQYSALLNVEAPELKINWEPKINGNFAKRDQKIRKSSDSALLRGTDVYINFPWLVKQIYIINNEIETMGTNYLLTKISWSSGGGFSLFVKEKQNFVVLLGNDVIATKIKRLTSLLSIMKAKNVSPAEIDLDYRDKAIVKII